MVKGALVKDGEIKERFRFATPSGGPSMLLDALEKELEKRGIGDFERIGVGVPGMVNPMEGIVRFPPNLPGWEEVYLKEMLEDRLGRDVFVINDANAAVLGEWRFGAGRSCENVVMLTLGTGIGGGVIVHGRLLLGANCAGAELGHLIVDADGAPCNCGNLGCLEAYIGSIHFLKRARDFIDKWGETILFDARDLDMEIICNACKKGDELALYLMREYGRYLGYGLVTLVHIFDPEVIILGGGVCGAYEFFSPSMLEVLNTRLMKLPMRKLKIRKSELGNDAGIMGAYYLALKRGNV